MAAPGKCPDELRERATRMAVEARRDPATRSEASKRIGEQLGVNPETSRDWVIQAEIDEGHRPGTTTSGATGLAELERGVRELRRADAITKGASALFAAELDRPPADPAGGVPIRRAASAGAVRQGLHRRRRRHPHADQATARRSAARRRTVLQRAGHGAAGADRTRQRPPRPLAGARPRHRPPAENRRDRRCCARSDFVRPRRQVGEPH